MKETHQDKTLQILQNDGPAIESTNNCSLVSAKTNNTSKY
jgi:hypothetical protein